MSSPSPLYSAALRLLSRKDYTSFEMHQKLRKAFPQEADRIPAVLSRLEEEGILNDQRYMERFVELTFANRLWSLRKLREKLLLRGIDAGMLQRHLPVHYDEEAIVHRLWEEFVRPELQREEVVKFIASLERKGFFLATILRIVPLDQYS